MVYLDHAATTPLRSEALEAYRRNLELVGNPASLHRDGQRARRVLEDARESVAETLGCDPIEVIFTSGGTESINLALKGLFWSRPGGRVVAPLGEHHATLDTLEWLEQHESAAVEWVDLDGDARVGADAFAAATAHDPASVALATALWANNEVGTIQPVERLAAACADPGIPLHIDAVAAYGHVPIDFSDLRSRSNSRTGGLVALSVSAHKIGGPVGIGALVASRQSTITPLIHGGGQQRSLRSGTQTAAAAAAFAAAARASEKDRRAEQARLRSLRDRLVESVASQVPEAQLSGPALDSTDRLATTAHLIFPHCDGDSLLYLLDQRGISVSTGSSCQAGVSEPSHVVLAMGRDEESARAGIRFTLGHSTSPSDIDAVAEAVRDAYERARNAGVTTL